MNYIIWFRKTNDPSALWGDMSYAPRSREDAEALVRYYEEEWCGLYEYEVHRGGICPTYPKGMRQPCFVGIND